MRPEGDYNPDDPGAEPRRLPHHIERERQRQAGYMPDEDTDGEVSLQGLYDFLWPAGFYIMTLFNVASLVAVGVGFVIAGSVDPWKQLQVVGITLGTHCFMVVIYKWVIKGPDGPPRFRRVG